MRKLAPVGTRVRSKKKWLGTIVSVDPQYYDY